MAWAARRHCLRVVRPTSAVAKSVQKRMWGSMARKGRGLRPRTPARWPGRYPACTTLRRLCVRIALRALREILTLRALREDYSADSANSA